MICLLIAKPSNLFGKFKLPNTLSRRAVNGNDFQVPSCLQLVCQRRQHVLIQIYQKCADIPIQRRTSLIQKQQQLFRQFFEQIWASRHLVHLIPYRTAVHTDATYL